MLSLRLSNVLRRSINASRGLRFFSQANKASQDLDLLKTLQTEISYELALKSHKNDMIGSLGDFEMEWDSPKCRDVFLRKKCRSGEEVVISAIIGRIFGMDSGFPAVTEVEMKVCIKKPSLSSILQFNCVVSNTDKNKYRLAIRNAYYIPSASSFGSSLYRGPAFCDLDDRLQDELKKFLEARGIEESLLSFLLLHMQQKEQRQYLNWLQKLESALVQ